MRIAAIVAVIAVVASTAAGCGSNSSSSSPPPQTTIETPAEPTTAALATTTAPATTRTAVRTEELPPPGLVPKTVPPHLVGQPLRAAERRLRDAGISFTVIRLHGHAGGAASGWDVCETHPAPGERVSSERVDLITVHSKCGAR